MARAGAGNDPLAGQCSPAQDVTSDTICPVGPAQSGLPMVCSRLVCLRDAVIVL